MTEPDTKRKLDEPADWQPQASAVGLPDGERRRGPTGQMFEARGGQWERVVRVGCRQPNGLMIRLMVQEANDPFQQPRLSAAVRLNGPPANVAAGAFNTTPGADFGTTEVDAEFWRAWRAQNAGRNPILDGGTVFLLDDEEQPAQNPT